VTDAPLGTERFPSRIPKITRRRTKVDPLHQPVFVGRRGGEVVEGGHRIAGSDAGTSTVEDGRNVGRRPVQKTGNIAGGGGRRTPDEGGTVLSDEDVEAIPERYGTAHLYRVREIAERYDVARTHVGYIVSAQRRGESSSPLLYQDPWLRRRGGPEEH
jgi:hypothetical protein